jgi:hypothetical protein
MVEDRVTDGKRIAQLLASEVRGHEHGPLGPLEVTDVEDAEGTVDGEYAYAIAGEGDDDPLAEAYVHPDRAHLEFRVGQETAAEAAGMAGLRVRPKAVEPPWTLVFVESGAEVKRAVDVLRAVAEAVEDGG